MGDTFMEVNVQTLIQNYLKFLKGWVFKTITSNRNGTPDVIACIPITQDEANRLFKQGKTIGLFVAVEVKDTHKKAEGRKLQEIQLRRIREAGGIAIAANSLDLVKEELSRFKI